MQYYFTWLGSKRAAKQGVGPKGTLLDLAARRNLPVPNGGVLLDSFYRLCLEEGVVHVEGTAVSVPKPEALYDLLYTAVRFPQLDKPIALRTAFSADSQPATLPPAVCLNVDSQDPAQLAAALQKAWAAAGACPETVRRDLLLLEMVTAKTAGTAVLQPEGVADQIAVSVNSDAAKAVSELPQLKRWQRSQPALPLYAQRLQQLLRGVRRTFGDAVSQVEWLDDGHVCWLLQLGEAA